MAFTELRLSGGPAAPAKARRALRERLGDAVPEQLVEDAGLLVSELVTNAVRHGRTGEDALIGVRLSVDRGRLRVEVRDLGPGFAATRDGHRPDAPGGYGLFLVTQLADAWGVAEEEHPTTVWFELEAA